MRNLHYFLMLLLELILLEAELLELKANDQKKALGIVVEAHLSHGKGAVTTLIVQSGKPVAVFKSHEDAPRVLIANSNIVPYWATQSNFDKWEAEGLIMYGQMTAGSWIYIGTQGILQGTFETFAAAAKAEGWPSLKGKWVLTAGLGEMGGAQPLAVTMNGGAVLVVDVDPKRIRRRVDIGFCDK